MSKRVKARLPSTILTYVICQRPWVPDCKKFSPLFSPSGTSQSTIPYHTISDPLLLRSRWSLSSEPLAIHDLTLAAYQIDATAAPIRSRNLNSILTVRDAMLLLPVLVRDARGRDVLVIPLVFECRADSQTALPLSTMANTSTPKTSRHVLRDG